MTRAVPRRVLPIIVFAQFAGTSLWFAVNAILPDLQQAATLAPTALAALSSAVQLGFVAGTLVFSLLMLADRIAPARVFLACALAGSALNAAVLWTYDSYPTLLALRFAVGFVLAGIYPVGMKIAASWYREGLGTALGLLVGALFVGTALPHGLRALALSGMQAPWEAVVAAVSLLAAAGGLATWAWVPAAPHATRAAPLSPRALALIWTDRPLRASVFGYFGHMWELYAFIVLVPLMLAPHLQGAGASAAAFCVIAAGAIGSVAGGFAARRAGSARVAGWQLAASGSCCVLAPLILAAPLPLLLAGLLFWGATVAGDSPQLSALTARNAPPHAVGSVLTFANSIGFGISVISIELAVRAAQSWPLPAVLPWLAVGPAVGLWMLRPLLRRTSHR